jgi:hypothetical protein
MTRSRGNVAYTVEGFREGAVARSFSIDEKLRSIIRLEWKEGDTVSAWTYEAITGDERNGFYPKRMGLEVSTTDKIRTEVFKVGPASERQLADFKNLVRGAKQAADLPDKAFEALRVLLNFG